MRVATLGCALVIAGCGAQSSDEFLLETTDCAVVNNLQLDGAATAWTDCRVFWSGLPYQTLTVELTTPGTSGSFSSPNSAWLRASMHVPGEIDGELTAVAFAQADRLPSTVDEGKIALEVPLPGCTGLASGQKADVMAEVGDRSVSVSLSLQGACPSDGFPHMYSGGFILTAAAKAGSDATGDPYAVVTVP